MVDDDLLSLEYVGRNKKLVETLESPKKISGFAFGLQ
jgi:tetrahydromethanopterin S-methyltransferase subunit F